MIFIRAPEPKANAIASNIPIPAANAKEVETVGRNFLLSPSTRRTVLSPINNINSNNQLSNTKRRTKPPSLLSFGSL